jgi:hypothetical protein
MKKQIIFKFTFVFFFILNIEAQNTTFNNVAIGTDDPAYGVKIKSNFPGYTGGWARSFSVSNENGNQNFISFGTYGTMTNGVTGFNRSYIGRSWNDTFMDFLSNGNVGIGTNNPLQKFVVSNGGAEGLEVYLGQPTGTVGLQVYNRSTSQYNKMAFAASQFTFNFGNFGIGTDNPRANLDMAKDVSNGQVGTVFGRLPEGDGSGLGTYLGVKGFATQGADVYNIKSFSIVHDFYGQTNSSINFYRGGSVLGGFMTFSTSDNTEKMRIATNGNVGIGTTTPDAKLTVNGNIHAKEVKIDLSIPAPDYVFASDYKLKSLQEIEEYINKNSHLPEIPSAKEIEKNGLLLAEMNMNLLKKVEELTIYAINQEKKIKEQSKENEILSERLSRIESQLKRTK